VDIDGPLLLAQDRDDPVRLVDGVAEPASPRLWG
jgi:hypothetical protein